MSVQEAVETEAESRETKHIIADTLAANTKAVAVISKTIQGETVERFILGLENGYAEVLPSKPRATRIKRFTVCKRIDELSANDDVEIKAQAQLTPKTQRDIARKVAPLRKEDKDEDERQREVRSKRTPSSKPERDDIPKEVKDDPTEVLDIASKAADTSEEHGGGWD